MPPDARSVSFVFHRDMFSMKSSPEEVRSRKNLRRRLQDRFDKEQVDTASSAEKESSEKAWHNISFSQVSTDSKRVLRSGAEKFTRTISSVRSTFGSITQKFKSSTRRRRRLEEQQSPESGIFKTETPQTHSRIVLGRTPTKMYSPFGIETPNYAWGKGQASTPTSNLSKDSTEGKRRLFRFAKVNGFCALR